MNPSHPPGRPATTTPPRRLASTSPREPVDPTLLPDATVSGVVYEVVVETVAARVVRDPHDTIAYVTAVSPEVCGAAGQCLPLAPVLDVAAELAGHLHRAATDVAPSAPDPVALDLVAELIASRVARDLLDVRLAQAQHQVANLKLAQEGNRTIGVAIGVLMTTHRCTATEAFELLKTASQNQNRKLRDIAAEVPYTGTILDRTRAVG